MSSPIHKEQKRLPLKPKDSDEENNRIKEAISDRSKLSPDFTKRSVESNSSDEENSIMNYNKSRSKKAKMGVRGEDIINSNDEANVLENIETDPDAGHVDSSTSVKENNVDYPKMGSHGSKVSIETI